MVATLEERGVELVSVQVGLEPVVHRHLALGVLADGINDSRYGMFAIE